MDEFFVQAGRVYLPLTISVVLILFFANTVRDRPHPLRKAVDAAPTHVTRWMVWIALALAIPYSILDVLDRWGVWVLAGYLAFPFVACGAALPVVRALEKRRGATRSEPSPTPIPTADERSGGL